MLHISNSVQYRTYLYIYVGGEILLRKTLYMHIWPPRFIRISTAIKETGMVRPIQLSFKSELLDTSTEKRKELYGERYVLSKPVFVSTRPTTLLYPNLKPLFLLRFKNDIPFRANDYFSRNGTHVSVRVFCLNFQVIFTAYILGSDTS